MVGSALAIVAAVALALASSRLAAAGPLWDYVYATPDDSYNWELVNSFRGPDYTVYNIFLTSQTWMSLAESNTPVWTHWLSIGVPDVPLHGNDIGLLYIDGGSTPNKSEPPSEFYVVTEILCAASRTVVAYLTAIPNQPIVFSNDPSQQQRTEDELISWTWAVYINNTYLPDSNQTAVNQWLARFPMAKAAVRAMDAVQEFVATQLPSVTPIERFVLGGASKRGWDCQVVTGIDSRVIAEFPIVSPVGALFPQLSDMYRSYGEFSFVLEAYQQSGVTRFFSSQVVVRMMQLISPLAFNDNYTNVEKLFITDCGDEFFLADGSTYMWPHLAGPKLLRQVANAEHSLTGHVLDVTATVEAWYSAIVTGRPIPATEYAISADGTVVTLKIVNGVQPKRCGRLRALNAKARDFRLIVCGDLEDPSCINPIFWVLEPVADSGNLTFVSTLETPQTGWAGHFVECEFDIGGLSVVDPFKVTSGVSIIPQTFPYDPCPQSECGWLAPGEPEPSPSTSESTVV